MSTDSLLEKSRRAGQEQVFAFRDQLSPTARRQLAAEAAEIDLDEIARLADTLLGANQAAGIDLTGLAPAGYAKRPEHGGKQADWDKARAVGEDALRAGRVA